MPSAGTGKANLHAHSPSIAHACVHSRGVRARHPSSGVRSSPPSSASVGDPGTAEVDRSSDRLDLWTRGFPPSSTAVAPVVPWAACFDGGLECRNLENQHYVPCQHPMLKLVHDL